jgi:hypothetical protein
MDAEPLVRGPAQGQSREEVATVKGAEGAGEFLERLLKGNVIDVGEVRVSRSTLKGPKGPRFLIYLPTTRNYLWRELHKSGRKVRVFIEVL